MGCVLPGCNEPSFASASSSKQLHLQSTEAQTHGHSGKTNWKAKSSKTARKPNTQTEENGRGGSRNPL